MYLLALNLLMAVRGAVHLLFHLPSQPLLHFLYVTASQRHSVTAGCVWPATGGGVVVWWCKV
jgi:hypothetical protein